MSFYDDASLVFLPSGGAGKNTKAYSIKPTDGSGDFTFSRGNNLSATRVDSNGLIEKGRENLLLQSNQFDTTWVTSNTSVTSGQSGYDGSSDAWLLEATGTSSTRVQQTISTDSVQTFSVYAKKGTSDYFQIRLTGSTTAFAFFDLANGTIGTLSNQVDASITSVGNGWYRCSLVRIGAATSARVYVTGNNTTSVSVGDNIYIQDAQLEQGLVATEYIESGASTGKAGILEDSPRFDYSGGASCPSLLLEPSRTNLVKHSEYIGSLYSEVGTSVTDNATQSPNGTNEAALIYEDLVNNSHWVQTDVTTSSSTTYTQSAFVKKKDSGIYASLRTNGVGANSYIIFDFDTATIVDEGSDIISSGVVDYSNGWYRIYMTYTKATISFIAGITNSTTNPIPSYLGTGKGYYLWGLQLEEGSYPTSYIPNHSGTTGTISTRNADSSTLSGIINGDAAFTFMIESGIQDYGSSVPKYFDAGALGYINHNTSNTLRYRFGGSNYVQSISGLDSFKFLLRYDSSEIKVYFNGSLEHTISASLSGSIGLSLLGGLNKQILLFPTALSDADCITLTS